MGLVVVNWALEVWFGFRQDHELASMIAGWLLVRKLVSCMSQRRNQYNSSLQDFENSMNFRCKFLASFLMAVCYGLSLNAADGKPEVATTQPPSAIAPFDASKARGHQAAWARHLGIAAEIRNSLDVVMVLIPPGEYQMGSSDAEVAAAMQMAESVKADKRTRNRIESAERPPHRVRLTRPFLLGKTEITIGQFREFVSATRYVTEAEKYGSANTSGNVVATSPQKEAFTWRWPGYNQTDRDAVSQVTWNDVVVFCNWLSEREKLTPCYVPDAKHGWRLRAEGTGYRLPTEAEWEYACRAGTTGQFSFGDDIRNLEKYAWFQLKSGSRPSRAVGSKLPNPFGLSDMHGNVFEWCQDGFDPKSYASSPKVDPVAPEGTRRVMRGGDWFGNPIRCRSAFRGVGDQTTRSDDVGFRLARTMGAR